MWRAITRQRGHEPVFDRCEQMVAGLATPPARRAGDAALRAVRHAREVIAALTQASRSRQEQQARRVADLAGDAVALAAMAVEADADGFEGVPGLYPMLFGDAPLDAVGCRRALTALGR